MLTSSILESTCSIVVRPAAHLAELSSDAISDIRTSDASAGLSSESEHSESDSVATPTVWRALKRRADTLGGDDIAGEAIGKKNDHWKMEDEVA